MISFPVRTIQRHKAYILKLTPPAMPGLVENEYFFMQMARALSLETGLCRLIHDRDKQAGLLVERFDRRYLKVEKRTQAIHQEDACQFLGRYPADKYRLRIAQIADGMNRLCASPKVEIARLIRLLAFSYLICNGDLHARNISIGEYRRPGAFSLSPAYDLLSTLPYGDRSMALEFEGRKDNFRRTDFVNFGKRYGIREGAVRAILDELSDLSAPWLLRLDETGLRPKQTLDLKRIMSKRRADLCT